MDGTKAELKLLNIVGIKITNNIRKEIVKQGHHLTGALEASIHGTALTEGNKTKLIGGIVYYGAILNAGVTAARIPYYEGSGNKHSKYIDGLIAFWRLRGLSEKEATSAAFATAKKQKKEGMPTSGSYAFSKTGQRKGFVQIVDKAIDAEMTATMLKGIDNIIQAKFNETKSETI